jgi:hypothetical protein
VVTMRAGAMCMPIAIADFRVVEERTAAAMGTDGNPRKLLILTPIIP